MKSKIIICFVVLMPFILYGQKKQITIASASDMRFALDSIIKRFEKSNKAIEVKTVYGSTGKLYEQINQGAPFDLFFAADISYLQKLKSNNKLLSKIYSNGRGRIAIWSKNINCSVLKEKSLTDANVNKIAVANPKHAPYGKRAEEFLIAVKLYDKVKNILVFGENVSQTFQFVETGAAAIGIIAFSFLKSPEMKNKGFYYLVPEKYHAKLNQGFVVLKQTKSLEIAQSFAKYMHTKESIAILKFYGYSF